MDISQRALTTQITNGFFSYTSILLPPNYNVPTVMAMLRVTFNFSVLFGNKYYTSP